MAAPAPPATRVLLFGNSFASAIQIPALRWAGPVQLLGIAGADLDKARATAEREGILHATDRWEDLLDLGADLVLVSTPVHLHHPMVLGVLRASPPETVLLCEKPMALDATQAEEMTRLANGRPAFLDHQLRFHPDVRELRARLPTLGTLQHARLRLFLPAEAMRARPWTWWFDADRGGGMLGAIGSHALDLLRSLFGDVCAVRADLDRFVAVRNDDAGIAHPVTADTFASLSVRFAGGGRGEFWTGFGLPGEAGLSLEVACSEGGLRWDAERGLSVARHGAAPECVQTPPTPTSAELGLATDQGVFSRALPLFLRELLGAIQAARAEGGPMDAFLPDAATFADGLAIQRVLDAARRSSETGGGWLEVPPATPR